MSAGSDGNDAGALRRAPLCPHLYMVGARALFRDDNAWLDALERVAGAASSWLPLAADDLASAASDLQPARLRLALQVRIEASPGAAALAARACARLRRVAAALPLYLNAAADAQRLGYDGPHWPERRIPTTGATQHPAAASVHSAAALAQAAAAGAAFVVFGAIWAPAWKDVPALGLAALTALATTATIPVVAIGGVTPARVGDCLRAGASGVAVASGLFRAPDSAAALAAYVTALQHSEI